MRHGAGRATLVVLAVGLVVPAVGLAAAPAFAESVRSFLAEIDLEPDGSFRVEETLLYDFGAAQRHGIYRDIPVLYDRSWGERYRMHLDVEAVTDATGRPRPYRVQEEGRTLRIRVGDPARTLTGEQSYRIRYRVRRGVLFFDEHDELYWNVTGNGWPVPIAEAQAVIRLPAEAGSPRAACFTGPPGSTRSACTAESRPGTVRFAADASLGRGEGLTVVVGLPKNVLSEPGALRRGLDRMADLGGAWLLSPLLAAIGMYGVWRRRGRDPLVGRAIAVQYEPPADLTPAEVGTLVDERVDLPDLSSTLLDLAVRGYLKIEEIEGTRFLFLSDRDYKLHRLRAADDALREHERLLVDGLFAGGDSVLLSSLRENFYESLAAIKTALYVRLADETGHFVHAPQHIRRRWLGIAGVLAAGAVFAGFVGMLRPWAAAAVLVGAGVVALVGQAMPRKTPKGRRAYEAVLGFREFLERVDADRLERFGGRTADNFERVLPYAVVLGAADRWADLFADVYTQAPAWYQRAGGDGSFVPRHFVGDVGRALQTIGETLASRPAPSGGGVGGLGGSGFGGGGFSGGGFGGGGGGSW